MKSTKPKNDRRNMGVVTKLLIQYRKYFFTVSVFQFQAYYYKKIVFRL